MMSMMGFGMIGMVLLGVLVLVGVFLLVRWLVTSSISRGQLSGKDVLGILKERYARGEIDHEEFEGKRRELGV